MITFVVIAALMTIAALAFVLLPLLRPQLAVLSSEQSQELNLKLLREQLQDLDKEKHAQQISEEHYLSAKAELERRTAEELSDKSLSYHDGGRQKKWALGFLLIVPAMAIFLYLNLGDRDALNPALVEAADPSAHDIGDAQIVAMVSGLEERLKKDPNNPDGWYMLARSYNTMKRFDKAAEAFVQLNKLIPDNADLLADYSDTLAMTQNRSLQGAPEKLIDQALTIDPQHIKALSLSGSAAFERQDYQRAITQWKKIVSLLPADAEMSKLSLSNISEAQSLLGTTDSSTATPTPGIEHQTSAAPVVSTSSVVDLKVSGSLDIDPALRAKVNDTDSVFIFARPTNGGRMPLLVLRKQVKDLPLNFELDDSLAIAPNTHLSEHSSIVVGARVSKDGNAIPKSGDPEGLSLPMAPGASGIRLHINQVHQ